MIRSQLGGELANVNPKAQLGLSNAKYVTVAVVLTAQTWADSMGGSVLSKLDIRNAFNTLDR